MAVAVTALFVALGGTSYALSSLPKGSVGTKQIKNGAVTTKKIKNGAVTDSKIAKLTITGDKIQLNTLGTVPNATHATNADNAANAGTANLAHNIDAPEAIHIVGAAGEPAFQNSCTSGSSPLEPVGFWKDKEGLVHLQGGFSCPATGSVAFQLPSGYRPDSGKVLAEAAAANGCSGGSPTGTFDIVGPGVAPGDDGAVIAPACTTVETSGTTFRPGA
jgi:hypothetical protein